MLKGQTSIGKILALCPAGTEPLSARLRLSHLFGSADLAPPGFPPRAVLVIRRAQAARGVALSAQGTHTQRAAWEREIREQVAALWRRAARPERGLVPTQAEAALFADEGEWLAALGLAFARQEVGRHWCWRDPQVASAASSPSQMLVRVWAESPRFVPAALVRLAQWGEAARVLGALQPHEAAALLSALRSEFSLPSHDADASASHVARSVARRGAEPAGRVGRRTRGVEPAASRSSEVGAEKDVRRDEDAAGVATVEALRELSPPWRRWLAPDGGACERLHAPARSLLSFAAALFHAPAHARSREFAEEVFDFNEGVSAQARSSPNDTPPSAPRAARPHANETTTAQPRAHNADGGHTAARASIKEERYAAPDTTAAQAAHDASHEASQDAPQDISSALSSNLSPDVDAAAHPTRDEAGARSDEAALTVRSRDESEPRGSASVEDVEEGDEACGLTEEQPATWSSLGGCETRLGGALFLLNLLAGLRLPECFDEDCHLSEYITGWGLTELLARALLGETIAEYEGDPLWGALADLDGRAEGEPPADGLRVGQSFRLPARWLKLFASRAEEDVWLFEEDEGRLVLSHAAGFPVAVLPLEGREPSALAAQVADEYRAHGLTVTLSLEDEGGRMKDEGGAKRPLLHPSSFILPSLNEDLRRWMDWTFPFQKYALRRSLMDEGEESEGDGAARALLVRRGRLHCTPTHVDLVLELSGLSFEARRAGLDASPGWVRDLMRVVTFHYE